MREAPLRIECREGRVAPPEQIARHAGAVLSGGIDSLATLRANHLTYPAGHPLRIADCVFLYGFDMGISRDEFPSFDRAHAALSAVALDAGITLISARTNVRSLDTDLAFWMYAFHGAALSAVAHVLSRRLATFFIGSYDLAGLFMPYGSHPLLDPCYSSAGLRVRSDGYAFTRLEKVALVASWDVGLRNLRVCTMNVPGLLNCGDCEKCIRTMTELLVVGKLADATAFPVRDVTPELLSSVVIDSEDLDVLYAPLVAPLRSLGRNDLADVIDLKSRRFHEHLDFVRERDLKGLIKRFDRRVLGGRLIALRNAFKDPAVVAQQEAERRLWGAGEDGSRARGAGRLGRPRRESDDAKGPGT